MPFLAFPPGFLWGTATAAHQVEGQNYANDWWDWEQIPGKIRNSHSSRVAAGWWGGRYLQDFDLARSLGMNTLRLSVEWSRIEPAEGEFDLGAIEQYRRMLEALHERGMTPLVTLHHFTNPRWLAARGGWENPATVQLFARFARRMVGLLSDLCSFWVTLNEPNVYAYEGYASGYFPPGVRDFRRALSVMANEVRAHAGAYYAIKDAQPSAQVGMAHHFRVFYSYRGSPVGRLVAQLRNHVFNRLILLALRDGHMRFPLGRGEYLPEVKGTEDFIGVNYYYTDPVAFDLQNPTELFGRTVLDKVSLELKELFSSVGNIEAWGLEQALSDAVHMERPIYITENGIFHSDDYNQAHYLVAHLAAVHRAIQEGVNIRGYYWWTLTDNFEWAEGYTSRFGLYHLDVETQARTPRTVANVYARIIRENGISSELQEEYGRPHRIRAA